MTELTGQTPTAAVCDRHPERPARHCNDFRTKWLCDECYAEWLELWRLYR